MNGISILYIRSFYRCVIVVAAAFGIGSAFLRDLFCVVRRPLPCDVEHDVCKHVDEIVTWLCQCHVLWRIKRARSAREDSSVYIHIIQRERERES